MSLDTHEVCKDLGRQFGGILAATAGALPSSLCDLRRGWLSYSRQYPPLRSGEIGPTGLSIQLDIYRGKRAREHAQGKVVLKAV